MYSWDTYLWYSELIYMGFPGFTICPYIERVSLVAQLVKNVPAMQETWVWFLGQEDLLYFGLENSMDCILHGVTKNSGTTEQVSLSLPLRNSLSYKRVENSGTVRSQIPVRLWSISHSAQMCPTLWSHGLRLTRLICPWDSPGKNSVLIAIFFSRVSSWPRNRTRVSCIASGFFTSWATREAQLWGCPSSATYPVPGSVLNAVC